MPSPAAVPVHEVDTLVIGAGMPAWPPATG